MRTQSTGVFLRTAGRGRPSETLGAEGTRTAGQGTPAREPRDATGTSSRSPLATSTRGTSRTRRWDNTNYKDTRGPDAEDQIRQPGRDTGAERPRTLRSVGAKGKNVYNIRNTHHKRKRVIRTDMGVGGRTRHKDWNGNEVSPCDTL